MSKWIDVLAILAVALCGATTFAAEGETDAESKPAASPSIWQQIDEQFAEWDKWDSPGASLAVVRDGELVYARGYGNAHLEYPIPITPSTVFHVASVSKQFTCFAVVLLAAEGKLSLDDDIRQHLPDAPDFGHRISVRQLMHHISGIRDQWELLRMAGWRLDDVITREHILRLFGWQRDLNFEPGSEYMYCNTGYTLLAEIVARVSGQSFEEFTQQRIFKPLAMSRTHFHSDHEMIVPGRAYSYAPRGDGFRKSVLSYANVGATSLFTTAEDLARWLVNLDEGRVGGAEAMATMHERGVLNDGEKIDYALGLSHSKYRGLKIVGHGGSDAGFRTAALRVPEHKLGVVVLSNLGSFNPTDVARRVAAIVLADHVEPLKEKEKPQSAEPIDVEPDVLDRYVGLYHLDNGLTVTLTRRGRRLIGQLNDMDPATLEARSPTEFFLKQFAARVVFEDRGDQPAEAFTAYLGDQKIRGKRLEPGTPEELDAYAGSYYSPELRTTYTISHEDGKLVARHQRNPDVELRSIGSDEFAGGQWFLSKVNFERQDDQVTGFLVTGGRVRKLRFERSEPER